MSTLATWPAQAQSWLDDRGKPAWMIAIVLGFIFFWPVGLALLFYMIWSKRMFNGNCGRGMNRGMNGKMGRKMGRGMCGSHGRDAMRPSGNSAFDAYKADTLRRLEDEQQNFEAFLGRLRDAKDKAEFDDFMRERADSANDAGQEDTPDETPGKS